MTRMAWPALRLAVAELQAVLRMRAEACEARDEAAQMRELARRRCTVRPSRWSDADRKTWRRHAEIQKSLKGLRADCVRNPRLESTVKQTAPRRARVTTCPACAAAFARCAPAT